MTFTAKPTDGPVWITGASEGIGAHLAREFSKEGFTVYVSARTTEKLEALSAENNGSGKIVPLTLDVTDRDKAAEAVALMEKEAGPPAAVVLNAGTFKPQRAGEITFDALDLVRDVNVGGVLNCLLPAIDAMKRSEKGQIAVVASCAGYGGLPNNASYGLTKAGLINMCESMKFDLDRMGIKIQVVTPGFVDTPLTEKNEFPMPFLIEGEEAARRIYDGMRSDGFEITFPKRLTYILKFINLLPYPLYFWATKMATKGG